MPNRPRGISVSEAIWPAVPEELVALAREWLPDATDVILCAIWAGYDRLVEDPRLPQKLAAATDDLERGITRLLEGAIQASLNGFEPFRVQHGVPEDESRKPPPARPPEYDIAFIFRGNERIMWPLEAKVMPPDRPTTEYPEAIWQRYLTCVYAPFCGEGGMIGYLLKDNGDEVLAGLAERVGDGQWDRPQTGRLHRVSQHERKVPEGKPYPVRLRLHHILLRLHTSAMSDGS